ncbi:hypothetical protein CEXT_212691 [Caerostris extrusa]|uniref:Uncharacterized protein n=1 Tax=Caerostris extrusa TaxID=172846 RepID=A0AAV4QHC5_CAEEX|nr:hypothetical protein CEXT_212691 [Caerostris extrusa]
MVLIFQRGYRKATANNHMLFADTVTYFIVLQRPQDDSNCILQLKNSFIIEDRNKDCKIQRKSLEDSKWTVTWLLVEDIFMVLSNRDLWNYRYLNVTCYATDNYIIL